MKINTDGVLLGALAEATGPAYILDIGTGTGVIAMMLAQRFTDTHIDAVEIDEAAAKVAGKNFADSSFTDKLAVYHNSFTTFFEQYPDKRYDLIVSNPPFYIDALTSPGARKNLAKHADRDFFNDLIINISQHLTEQGVCWLVLPLNTAELVESIAAKHDLFLQKSISISSFEEDEPHREIIVFGRSNKPLITETFIIYNEPKVYTDQYRDTLKEFFTIF
jgi:tRNA1Val (adenine37-N6)-methyltransferase